MTSDSYAADAEESTGQVSGPGPLVHRGAAAATPQPDTSELMPPLVGKGAGPPPSPTAPVPAPDDAGGHALDPAARDVLDAGGAGDVSDDAIVPAATVDTIDADAAVDTTSEPSGLDEVDLPWLTTPEDEDALDSGGQERWEDTGARTGMEDTAKVAGSGSGGDAPAEDPALLVAERLERIAHSLRTRGASGPLVELHDDPLAVLVAGYLLGITESKDR